MDDREVVAAIVAGDPAGLAVAYDRYAAPLYAYCRTMVHEPADAADAVQDTFVIASAKLGQLRDPSKLRTWLYAVARNECHRRLRDKKAVPGLDEMPEPADETAAEVGADAERAELRRLVHDALTGLNAGDREIIELNLRHEFEGPELTEVLGVSRNHAHAMLSRARNQLKTSLGALLVARTGRQYCEVLDGMLANWDGELTVLLRKQVNRHVDNCDICGERRRRELAPAALFSLLPVIGALPRGLRERVLRLCADGSPHAVQYRQQVTQHAGSYGPGGFPASAFGAFGASGRWQAARRGALVATPAAAVLVIAAVVFGALAAGGSHPAATTDTGPVPAVITASGLTSAGGASGSAGPSGSAGSPSASPTRPSAAAVVVVPPPASVSSSAAGSPRPTRSPSRSRAPSRAPSRPPSRPPSSSASPSPSPTPSPPPTSGTLVLSVGSVTLLQGPNGGPPSGSFTLTATGGPVAHYWIVITNSGLMASPQSGALVDGASVTITLTWSSQTALNTQILINPGQHPVTVLFTPPIRPGEARWAGGG